MAVIPSMARSLWLVQPVHAPQPYPCQLQSWLLSVNGWAGANWLCSQAGGHREERRVSQSPRSTNKLGFAGCLSESEVYGPGKLMRKTVCLIFATKLCRPKRFGYTLEMWSSDAGILVWLIQIEGVWTTQIWNLKVT